MFSPFFAYCGLVERRGLAVNQKMLIKQFYLIRFKNRFKIHFKICFIVDMLCGFVYYVSVLPNYVLQKDEE